MSETDQILMNTAARLFDDLITPTVLRDADAGGWPAEVWQAIEDVGLPLALVPEDHGGFGVSPQAALAVVRAAAHGAAPVPLPETMLAHRLLALAGMEAPTGPLAVAPLGKDDRIALSRTPAGMRVSGQATRVPWGRHATAVVLIADCDGRPHVVLATAADVKAGSNLAGEPRDDLSFDAILAETAVARAPDGVDAAHVKACGAALRANQIAGGVARLLDMTVQYASERTQFGRPIGKFQAVQQNLAVLAGQAAVTSGAADLAAEYMAGAANTTAVAVAKARTSEAAGAAAALAHQVHGAIGFTREHALHTITRRLWSWRDECGNETEWYRFVGRSVMACGADSLWPMIAAA